MSFKTREYTTDVLVLGAGAAGCGAAIMAANAGVETLLLDKGSLASCGALGGGNDHYMAVLDEDEHDSLEDLVGYFTRPGSGMPVEVIENFYKAMRPSLTLLEDMGLEFSTRPDGKYTRSCGFGQPGAWWIHIRQGYTVKPKMAKYIRKLPINVVNNVMVIKLLKCDNQIAGCAGFDVITGDFVVVHCKAAVLAFGPSCGRVSNNSTHKPFNSWLSPYASGSNVIQGLDVGAEYLNIEISDAATMIPKAWGAPGMNGINNMGGHELDANGVRFMGKYDPMLENGIRFNQVMGTFNEMLEGNGPPFYMDMRHFPKEEALHLQYDLMPGDKETYLDYCRARDIEFTRDLLEVEISERSLGGLARVNGQQETCVENLFVGSLLPFFSSAFCMGMNAGEAAARKAKDSSLCGHDQGEVEKLRSELYLPLEPVAEPITYTEFEDGIRQVMDYYVGFIRSEASLKRALHSFEILDEYKDRIAAGSIRDLMRLNESREIFRIARIYIEACLQRKESGRAFYKRVDFPEKSQDNRVLLTVLREGRPEFSWI